MGLSSLYDLQAMPETEQIKTAEAGGITFSLRKIGDIYRWYDPSDRNADLSTFPTIEEADLYFVTDGARLASQYRARSRNVRHYHP